MEVLKINKNKINLIKDKIINFLTKYNYLIFLSLPLISMDIITRLFGKSIDFYAIYKLAPNLFTLSWIILFLGFTLNFRKKIGKYFYLFINII